MVSSELHLRDHHDVIATFDRPNLHLAVEWFTDDTDKGQTLITRVRTLIADPATPTRAGLRRQPQGTPSPRVITLPGTGGMSAGSRVLSTSGVRGRVLCETLALCNWVDVAGPIWPSTPWRVDAVGRQP
jgi:hypothetical protein